MFRVTVDHDTNLFIRLWSLVGLAFGDNFCINGNRQTKMGHSGNTGLERHVSFPSKMEHVVYCHSFPSGTVFLCERGSRKTLFRQILDLIMHLRIRSNAKVISVLCFSSAVYNAINCNRRLQTPILNAPSLTLSHTIWHPCQAATSEIFLTHFANVNLMRACEGITLMQLENILIAHSSEPSACIQARFWLEF